MFVKSYTASAPWPPTATCWGDEETRLAALIDPGERGERLAAEVEKEGFILSVILLTHAHFDHIGGVRGVLDAVRQKAPERAVPIYVHEADYPAAPASFMRGATLDGVPGVRFYGEGDTVQVGSITVSVLSTPGHTKGGVCLMAGCSPGTRSFAAPAGGRTSRPAPLRRCSAPCGGWRCWGGLYRLPRPRGNFHPGGRAAEQPVSCLRAEVREGITSKIANKQAKKRALRGKNGTLVCCCAKPGARLRLPVL